MLKKTISGHEIELAPGKRYIATRPFFEKNQQHCTVSIRELDSYRVVHQIDNLSYDQSNDLLCAFNNGTTSFEGRIW